MTETNEKDNVISMLSGFTGDISTLVGVQISPCPLAHTIITLHEKQRVQNYPDTHFFYRKFW